MRSIFAVTVLAGALSVFVVVGMAQRAQENPSAQSQQNPGMPGMMGGGAMGQGSMMGGQGQSMTGQSMLGQSMTKMMAQHQQMTELMNKMTQSMAALQAEKDPKALASKLAEHRALLEQMRTLMGNQGGMMNQAAQQFAQGCPMSNTAK